MASVWLLFIVFVFDLIAFGLAVAAEQRRTTKAENFGPKLTKIIHFFDNHSGKLLKNQEIQATVCMRRI